MKDMYDVFISYRHESGSYVARHLADVLSRDGYTVFLDKESLKDQNRPFECVLYEKIDECKYFVIILGEWPLEKDGWQQKELDRACKQNKKIVPVTLSGDFKPDIKYTVIKYDLNYFDGFYKELLGRFNKEDCRLKFKTSVKRNTWKMLACVGVAAFIATFILHFISIVEQAPTPLLLIGGGSVKNKLIDLSDSATINKYINISLPSSSAWPIFTEEIGLGGFDSNKQRPYYCVLLSAKEAMATDFTNDTMFFFQNIGYVMKINIGNSNMQVALSKKIADSAFVGETMTVEYLAKLLKEPLCYNSTSKDLSFNIYTTTQEKSGTYSKYKESLFQYGVDLDSMYKDSINKKIKMRKYYSTDKESQYTHPFIILEADMYQSGAKDKKQFLLVDENGKSISNPLFVYFVIYKNGDGYFLPPEVRKFLADIGFNKLPNDINPPDSCLIQEYDTVNNVIKKREY